MNNEIVGVADIHGARLIVQEKIVAFANGFVKLSDGTLKESKAIILIDDTKLSQCLSNLPYGLVDKKITGIGGTTLELKAKRNSIIVEPLKAIASSKAQLDKQYLYVGSAIGPYKKTTSISDINAYHNSELEHKKIIVVADSLHKILEAIGSSIFEEYFIVIDEIDSFQCDSDYRSVMESCLDIYKKFPFMNRCMITATFIEFSDPDLKNEALTVIKYKTPLKRNIKVINSKTVKAVVANEIYNHLEKNEKVVIAYNSIDDTFDIITILKDRFQVNPAEIKIMCSQSNKKKAGIYFGEMSNEKLETNITFLTSAYFTGIDISEQYNSIAVSNSQIKHSLLSDHKLKQIAGRCRKGLLSETIVYNSRQSLTNVYTKKDLFELANKFRQGLMCFDRQFENDPISKLYLEDIQKNLIDNSKYIGFKLVRVDINKKREIAYFNIDSFLENQRVQHDLYSNDNQLPKLLESENIIDLQKFDYKWEAGYEKNKYSEERKEQLRAEAIRELQTSNINTDRQIDDLIHNSGSDLQSKLFNNFKELYKYIEKEPLIEKLDELSKSHDSKEFNYFKIAVKFEALDNSNFFKSQILNNFPINSLVTPATVMPFLNKICAQSGLGIEAFSFPQSAWRTFTSFFKTKYKKKKGDRGNRKFEIIGTNPDQVKIINKSNDHTHFFN